MGKKTEDIKAAFTRDRILLSRYEIGTDKPRDLVGPVRIGSAIL